MNEFVAKEVLGQAEKFFKNTRMPEPVQAIIQDSVGKSREFYSKAATVTQDGAKVLTELADTAWSSTKMLNDKIIQNATANAEATFDAAQAIARATSFGRSRKDPKRVRAAVHGEGGSAEQRVFRPFDTSDTACVRNRAGDCQQGPESRRLKQLIGASTDRPRSEMTAVFLSFGWPALVSARSASAFAC